MVRSAIHSGCSTKLLPWLMKPGMIILPSGSLTSRQAFHSWACLGLLASNEYAPTLIRMSGEMKSPMVGVHELGGLVRAIAHVQPDAILWEASVCIVEKRRAP